MEKNIEVFNSLMHDVSKIETENSPILLKTQESLIELSAPLNFEFNGVVYPITRTYNNTKRFKGQLFKSAMFKLADDAPNEAKAAYYAKIKEDGEESSPPITFDSVADKLEYDVYLVTQQFKSRGGGHTFWKGSDNLYYVDDFVLNPSVQSFLTTYATQQSIDSLTNNDIQKLKVFEQRILIERVANVSSPDGDTAVGRERPAERNRRLVRGKAS